MDMSAHDAGTFCWMELSTTNLAASQAFYGELFDWTFTADVATHPGASLALREDKPVAALHEGTAFGFTAYVAVESADDAVRLATSLGATVLRAPTDVATAGRAAVVRDPTGAELGLWQPRLHTGSALFNEAGSMCWTELATKSPAPAAEFYRGLFGWSASTTDLGPFRYTEFLAGERPVAGMQRITEDWGLVAPHWLVFFAVDDCDATAAHATSLGARVQLPPTELPRLGRYAVLADPDGATFGIFQTGAPE